MTEPTVSAVRAGLSVTRLAHFTPAMNLFPILSDGMIRSSKDLADNAPDYFTPTDRERFDRHPDHICCSFEYPNVYYLRQARAKPAFRNYRDWVCLLLDPALIERPGSLFCGCNAAYGNGAYLRPGGQALLDCWSDPSSPRGWPRGAHHHPAVPSDLQAEVLVPGPVPGSDLHAIVVPHEDLARELHANYGRRGLSTDGIEWKAAPIFFDPDALPNRLRFGGDLEEQTWRPDTEVKA